MGATPLRFHSLSTGMADGGGIRLLVATPSDQLREIPLDRSELMRILKASVSAIDQLDRDEARAARALPVVHEGDLHEALVVCGATRTRVEWSSVTTRTTCPDCIAERDS